MPRIIRAEPYLAVGDDDMAEKEPAEGQAYPDCAMCAPCPKCDDECGCVPGPCWWCGHVSVVKETPQEVIAAIFGKPSAQVTGKMTG